MFGIFNSDPYRQHVLDTVATLMVLEPKTVRRTLLREYPGIENAINAGKAEQQNRDELAITIAQLVLTASIEQIQERERLQRISRSLSAWVNADGIPKFKDDILKRRLTDIDGFELRLRAALAAIYDMQIEGRLEDDTCERFLKDITGALDGLDAEERERRRYVDVFSNVKRTLSAGEDDDGELMPADYTKAPRAEYSGIECDIEIISTPSGLVMHRKDNGEPITERRKLTQEILRQVPRDAGNLIFVNLKARSNEIYSCIIVEPGSDMFGDKRAAWWSLAKSIVRVTEAKANGVRMTKMANAHVCGCSRGMWESAIEQTPIHQMRDTIMPIRHMHLKVITDAIENRELEADKLGVEIALAMVMAIQSEDEKLERYAFNSFRKFLWVPGEEPEEFWQYVGA